MTNVPPTLGGSTGTGSTNPFDPSGPDTQPGPLASSLGGALTGGGIGQALSFVNTLGRPDFWIRAGIVVGGVGLLIVGIIVLVSSSKVVGDALTAAGKSAKLTPAGAATSVVAEAIT